MLTAGVMPAPIFVLDECPTRADIAVGEAFTGQSGKLLDKMINGAWCGSYMVQRSGYTSDDVLGMMPKITGMYLASGARCVILISKEVERFYKKVFPAHCTILSPAWILGKGGEASPWYTHNVNIIRRMINENPSNVHA